MKTTIIGLGHPLLGDDGVGLHCARVLAASDCRLHADIIESPAGLLPQVGRVVSTDVLVLIDAAELEAVPGTVVRRVWRLPYLVADLAGTAPSSHSNGVALALSVLEMMGRSPSTLILYGIVPAMVEAGQALSEPAHRACNFVTRQVHRDQPWHDSGELDDARWVLGDREHGSG